MLIRISSIDGMPIYQQIINQVKYLIASKTLSPGDQLPPVRKLAEELLINPNTVARVYRELETEGIIKTRKGAGVFVAEPSSPFKKKEQIRILTERIDILLTEAKQMKISINEIIEILEQRNSFLK